MQCKQKCDGQLAYGLDDKDVAQIQSSINSTAMDVDAWRNCGVEMPARLDFIAKGGYGCVFKAGTSHRCLTVAHKSWLIS